MITVHRYVIDFSDLDVDGTYSLQAPAFAEFLSVDWQPRHLEPGTDICLWAMVDDQQPMVARRVFLGFTGREVPDAVTDPLFNRKFLGTVVCNNNFVVHVWSDEEVPSGSD